MKTTYSDYYISSIMRVKKFNMKISPQKTKSMVISKEPVRCKLVTEQNITELTMGMKYLGIRLSSYGNIEDEVKGHVTKANRVAGCLNNTIWRNKYSRKETKTTLYKTVPVVRPIMIYTAETRPDTARTQRLLETTEMKVLRKQDQTPLELKRILQTTEMRVLRKQDQTPLELRDS
jgi:hypothetical protein